MKSYFVKGTSMFMIGLPSTLSFVLKANWINKIPIELQALALVISILMLYLGIIYLIAWYVESKE